MAGKYTGFIGVKAPLKPTKLQQELMGIIGNEKAMRAAHRLLGEFCEPYIPLRDGGLRASMKAYPSCVKWESPYAHYQYIGYVYEDNIPIIRNGKIVRWYSLPGVKKKKTKRRLGTPGKLLNWKFGYYTDGTGDHWLDVAMAGRGKNNYSIAVTKMLKKMAGE